MLDKEAKAAIGRKHAQHVHLCPCGREIRGNVYAIHRARCEAWQRWALQEAPEQYKEAAERFRLPDAALRALQLGLGQQKGRKQDR